MIYKTILTDKQIELMKVIIAGNGKNNPADLDEIIERVSYGPTKQSIQFSIRALVNHRLIQKLGTEKRRGRNRQVIQATKEGKSLIEFGAVNDKAVLNSFPEIEVDPIFLKQR